MLSYLIAIDPHMLRSLNKSHLRRKVLIYLDSVYPNADYLSNIARRVGSDASNILGCLRGMGNRYNGNRSLIELGLVEIVNINGYKYYKLTELGKKVAEMLKKFDKGGIVDV